MPAIATIRDFLRLEATAGICLVLAAACAIIWANSPFGSAYSELLATPVVVQIGALKLAKPLLLWINDGMMAIFFLVVGLEIKREILAGELSSLRSAALPGIAAVGGMVAPALVYLAVAGGDPIAARGWAVPAATDIAFALGVLSLLGPRIPVTLKIFLLALAIIDDIGAIVIIAIFYTTDLSALSLGLAITAIAGLIALNLFGVTKRGAYWIVGVFLWVCVLKSGVHATLAGIVLGFTIPMRGHGDESPLRELEHALHPWVTYLILPLFAFANAGVSLAGLSPGILLEPVPLGIALGLFVGKQVGVFASTWAAIRLGWASLPAGATWLQVYGVAMLTGIGFTMSLFIGSLAFPPGDYDAVLRIGVLAGSLVSAIVGWTVLRLAPPAARA